jgi:alanyl-tRNA synthetase
MEAPRSSLRSSTWGAEHTSTKVNDKVKELEITKTPSQENALFYEVPAPGSLQIPTFPPFGSGPISSVEVLHAFLGYYQSQNHLVIPNESLIPPPDSDLLFINSGVAGIIKYLTGESVPPKGRLTNVQSCIRTNDIDDIGDRRHQSIFYMLGNWAIGEYGKREAIEMSYNFLVHVLRFNPQDLYATVFAGDEELGLPPDEESAAAWEKMGIPKDHILYLPKEDNFWGPAGAIGPCGPCTELFFDTGEKNGTTYIPGRPETFDTGRYMEIWNAAVSMELFKDKDGKYSPLKVKCIDAGAGLERLVAVLNGFDNVYEIDLLKPIVEWVTKFLGINTPIEKVRMVTDHLRTSCYLLAEGVKPEATDRGYVLRKLIRKCVTAAMSSDVRLNFESILSNIIDFIAPICPQMGNNREFIISQFQEEVSLFEKTFHKAKKIVDVKLDKLKEGESKILDGEVAQNIVTTHGLPFDFLKQYVEEKGFTIDVAGFNECMILHKERSKQKSFVETTSSTDQISSTILAETPKTIFSGYDSLAEKSKILHLFVGNEKVESVNERQEFQFVVETSPFYAEGGGQVGDIGTAHTDKCSISISNTTKENGIFLHSAMVTEGVLEFGDEITLNVNSEHRAGVKRNHSATHLLHYAIRSVLGLDATQRGSLVEAKSLRFDVAYASAISEEDVKTIERIVNDCIRGNSPIQTELMDLEEARSKGVISLFGEKYEERVRVVNMGPSTELCGGTHARSTGDIGSLCVTKTEGIGREFKRFFAVTGPEAFELSQAARYTVAHLSKFLNVYSEEELLAKIAELKKDAAVKTKGAILVEIPQSLESKEITSEEKTLSFHRLNGTIEQAKAFTFEQLNQGKAQAVGTFALDEKSNKLTVFFAVSARGQKQELSAHKLISCLRDFGIHGRGRVDQAQAGTKGLEAATAFFSKKPEELVDLFAKK